ncbi:Prolyl endopeptidase [Corynebacterium faecale]|uniref:prolyl oligopeptidase family serine peptidase n=1 Tax=Corynebacterium faecale TaxID=1758466 RepID=UPI0025B55186|nr:prolyl oligopeptidase family serine peptidase [Corynebacterium faecale]WJY91161.1 Prolyl endopeptidase [Corynebacterium faecale]
MNDYSFLEPIDSPEALEWAEKWSGGTVDKLPTAPRTALQQRLLEALDTDDRIPYVSRRGQALYNFWRDATHPRGLWRTTTLESYLSGEPAWEVLIDVDALAEAEDENWVWKGAQVRAPEYDLALVKLSRGGADATVIREFDLETATFVDADPFTVPEAKTDVAWLDRDTLLIGTDTGEGSLTTSGYPARVLTWRRGEDLAGAPLFFAGEAEDVAVGAWVDPTPGWERTFVSRAVDFYNSREFVEINGELVAIEVPDDCDVVIRKQWIFINPRTEFAGIPAGGLGVMDFDAFLAGERAFQPVFTPTPSTSLQGLATTKNHLLLTLLDNVASSIMVVDINDPTGQQRSLPLPEHTTAHIVATSALEGDEIWVQAASFTQPGTLLRGDLSQSLELTEVRHSPLQWDNADLETRQHWATSQDGTKIPYFISGSFTGGPLPTLVHAYGGFEVSLTPGHSPTRGIAWMEKGYLFVEANLRGGGEFGPQWHSQATKLNRMRVFEDHRAVLEDLIVRGYTTPEQLAIRGGSNGGLLTSGALTQYPEAFGAAVVQVPLTDMLRYHTWSAGASWMAEYGNPDDPEERAVIESYSPLHNVVGADERPYPPALVTTSTRDDRVHPAHARLFAQALKDAGQPVDYYENTEGGHAGAADNKQVAQMESLIYTWIETALGLVSTDEG